MDTCDAKRILLFLARGFEDYEAVSVLSVCGWTEYRPHIDKVHVVVAGLHEIVRGRFGLSIPVDLQLEKVNPEDFDALVVPGGFHDHGYDEAYCLPLRELAKVMHSRGAMIATMCVGVLPIAEAGLLEGCRATTYAFSRSHDNFGRLQELGCEAVHEPVVVSNRIISCSGPAYSMNVIDLLLEDLVGHDAVREIAHFRSGVSSSRA